MNKEQLIEYLKNNLKIETDIDDSFIKISLKLESEIISSDYISIYNIQDYQ